MIPNRILDIFLADPVWAEWSEASLFENAQQTPLYINPIIYSEISIGFNKIKELEVAVSKSGFKMLEIPKKALFLAGKAFLKYRKQKGTKKSPLPDFFIGAQAAVLDLALITRDKNRYPTYFPKIKIISPE
ncbi:type II toxin-antitoxin system VapC family toxin [Desulfobotulus sp. H1]|uniref:Type II toxin-antitoxin system VapC family toxin n=1 Tax=Desulfobotulus pelophilus TaxID=2823377 RepID=A0ABT3NBL2_9BACT|nr:type II toxin-antitoxin system VapC family toxin [Desulfobotulus pelophilus]MCW7754848.1 type II toxin-antitoxin system VapC family toxin [Desulfobotulus pelophilus]